MSSSPSLSAPPTNVLVIVAHPDDECVGVGAVLRELQGVAFVCVTDGAPHNMVDAWRAGCQTREEYARLREGEMRAAVARAGHAEAEVRFLRVGDQQASFHLTDIARQLAVHIALTSPDVIITHAYEGGHPDHDATAWAVHAAVALQQEASGAAPEIVEMTSYHSRNGAFGFGEFLAGTGDAEFSRELDDAAKTAKRSLFACHGSQTYLLNTIPLTAERFRRAPAYDFRQPPHEGKLLYEQFPWGMSGERWRALAAKAGEEVGVPLTRRAGEHHGRHDCDTLEGWLRCVASEAAAGHFAGAEVRS